MSTLVDEVMSTELATLPTSATIVEAAQLMSERDIGDVLVTDDRGMLVGIVTDRDLVVRCLANGATPDTAITDACSDEPTTVSRDARLDEVTHLMRERALRRVPVVNDGRPIGIITLGDLAVDRDPGSVLGSISAAEPTG